MYYKTEYGAVAKVKMRQPLFFINQILFILITI